MDDEPEGLQKMKDFFNHHTVPMVFVQEGGAETFLGGYTELKEYFDAPIEWLKIRITNER